MMRRVTGRTDRVVVVGAGFAGLAAAAHLVGRDRQVVVLERGKVPGGRAGRLMQNGHRFDTGPSVITMPDVIEDVFQAMSRSSRELLKLTELTPAYDARFADGSSLLVHRDEAQMYDAIKPFAGVRNAEGYRRLRAWLERLYRAEFDRFVAANFDSPLSLLTPQLARVAALGGFRRLDPVIAGFIDDERLRRVFTFQSLYVGQAPYDALALYAVITYMDTVAGVYFPSGGVSRLPDALAEAATDAGVKFHYDANVRTLEKIGDRVTAVITEDGRRFSCDAVVLTTEIPVSYDLMGTSPRRPVPLRAAPSAVVLHAGLNREYADVAHHTISFGAAWRKTFQQLIRDGELMSDPSLLITRPTATDPQLGPPGRDTISILAPVPNLTTAPGIDWDTMAERYADELVDLVEQRQIPGLAGAVTTRHLITPADWAEQGMVAGTPFAWSHSFSQTGPFRPGNFPSRTENVVLAGGGTVPGVGVPTALLSGRLAADRLTGPVRTAGRSRLRAGGNR
ncbi:phytoene desaturase family protein [Kribbella sp. NPDC050820]|uniref:phytoene desaturase family protein n=1 Tax=Kribbella sp. NPDC050820 TaxID=3155408 RepID=UPI0033EC404A